MKTKIFIDTEPLWEDSRAFATLFRESFVSLPNFLKKHTARNVTICIPEIVIRERIQHKKKNLDLVLEQVNKGIISLREAGHQEEAIVPRSDYHEQLQKAATEYCKFHSIDIVSPPNISLEDLTIRAINKTKPFNDKASGFKDTLIYLSIVEDFKKNPVDNYILCTNNHNDFNDEVVEDFRNLTGKNLIILPDIISVQQKLDEIIPTHLHLEERNNQVRNLIKNNTGDLLLVANQNLTTKHSGIFGFPNILLTDTKFSILSTDTQLSSQNFFDTENSIIINQTDDNDPVGCSLNNIEFLTIEGTVNETVRAQVRLVTDLKYANDHINSPTSVTRSAFRLNRNLYRHTQPPTRSFNFTVDCDLIRNNIKILSWD